MRCRSSPLLPQMMPLVVTVRKKTLAPPRPCFCPFLPSLPPPWPPPLRKCLQVLLGEWGGGLTGVMTRQGLQAFRTLVVIKGSSSSCGTQPHPLIRRLLCHRQKCYPTHMAVCVLPLMHREPGPGLLSFFQVAPGSATRQTSLEYSRSPHTSDLKVPSFSSQWMDGAVLHSCWGDFVDVGGATRQLLQAPLH